MKLTVNDLARYLGGEVVGNGDVEIKGVSPVNLVKPGDVTFAENEKYFALAEQSPAVAIIVPPEIKSSSKVLIRIENPRVALAKVLAMFFPPAKFPAEIHPKAHVGQNVKLGKDVYIGPFAVVKDGASIGDRTAVDAGAVIGRDAVIGNDCVIHSNATIYHKIRLGDRVVVHSGTVIGSDGFGYVWEGKARLKIPQVGIVILEDDVEIGSNTSIDRATIGATIIKRGSKIDNLVQVAHNVVIGEHCAIAGQSGMGGSTTLGNNITFGAQVGIADHLKIGDNVMVGAKSGVKDDLAPDNAYLGIPAAPARDAARRFAAVARLPDLVRRVNELQREVESLRAKLNAGKTD